MRPSNFPGRKDKRRRQAVKVFEERLRKANKSLHLSPEKIAEITKHLQNTIGKLVDNAHLIRTKKDRSGQGRIRL